MIKLLQEISKYWLIENIVVFWYNKVKVLSWRLISNSNIIESLICDRSRLMQVSLLQYFILLFEKKI